MSAPPLVPARAWVGMSGSLNLGYARFTGLLSGGFQSWLSS
jgi:hypothetical protein